MSQPLQLRAVHTGSKVADKVQEQEVARCYTSTIEQTVQLKF